MKIEPNLNAGGKLSNIAFGLCEIASGLVKVLSFGYLRCSITLDVARWQARRGIQRLKGR